MNKFSKAENLVFSNLLACAVMILTIVAVISALFIGCFAADNSEKVVHPCSIASSKIETF